MFTKEIENTFAISISKEFLLDIEDILNIYFINIYCVATLKNKERKTFETIKSLYEYENALEKRIVKLEISAYSNENESIHLFFEEKEKTSIRGIVSTNTEKMTDLIYEKIDYAMRRKSEGIGFSMLARMTIWQMAYCILFIVWIIDEFIGPGGQTTKSINMFEVLTQFFVPLLELTLIYMAFVVVLHKIKKYFFPIIVFNIGDEILKSEKRNTLKKNITWAGFLAIVASIIGSFIYAKLTNG